MPGKDIPEIQWKTFLDEAKVVHVGPSIENAMMAGHQLDLKCACGPRLDRTRFSQIIVHYVIH